MDKKQVIIDGVVYVEKAQTQSTNYFIVRTRSAGVFAGEIIERNGMEVTMSNARRLWYWSGAASLSQLAMEGVKDPGKCKFPCEVHKVVLTEALEISPATEAARKSISEVLVWKR